MGNWLGSPLLPHASSDEGQLFSYLGWNPKSPLIVQAQGMYVHRRRTRIEIWTPAKLNLFLEVLSRRRDGFHEIETLMYPIDLYDTLYLSPLNVGQIQFSCQWAPGLRPRGFDSSVLPEGDDNLIVRALNLLREDCGTSKGMSVLLVKRIPLQAGLGGGSSDAAAALIGGNLIWNLNQPLERLSSVASRIGSDVPFFLHGSPAICRGRGEKVEALDSTPRLHFVLVRPPEGCSTARIYRDTQPATEPRRVNRLTTALMRKNKAAVSRSLFNRLQPAAERSAPWIGRLSNVFSRLDVCGHQMSGSGSCYFGVCRNRRHARRLGMVLRSESIGKVYSASACFHGRDHHWARQN